MHDIALVSITENIDYFIPQGRLLVQMLGSFAQFFSDMLGTHVSKGLDQRAEEVLTIISVSDEVELVRERRRKAEERMKRLGRAYVDGLFNDIEYRRQKRSLEAEVEWLEVPETGAASEAGRLMEKLPELWGSANLKERRKLLLTMLDAVYLDASEERRIVAIKPKAPFRSIFQVATMKEGSGIVLVKEPSPDQNDDSAENASAPPPHGQGAVAYPCSWWRRRRVELLSEHGLPILVAA